MSKKWVYVFFVLLLVVPLALAACGGDKGGEAKDLSETFESTTGLSFKYPKGWIAKDSDQGIVLANSEEMMAMIESNETDQTPPEGGFAVLFFDPGDMAMMVEAGQSPKDIAGQFSQFMGDEDTTVGDVEDAKVGGNEGAKVSITSSKDKGEGYLIVWQDGDTMHLAVVMAREGELGKLDPTAQKILESVSYTAPAGDTGGEG